MRRGRWIRRVRRGLLSGDELRDSGGTLVLQRPDEQRQHEADREQPASTCSGVS